MNSIFKPLLLEELAEWYMGNINEEDNQYKYKINLAGTKKKDIKLKAKDNQIIVSAKEKKYTINIPRTCEVSTIKANYEDGMLHISIDKDKKHAPREILID
tara:strand:+ start:466 stop:768 length:303 start_codon:yes stop_codon:yes gene_type:complete